MISHATFINCVCDLVFLLSGNVDDRVDPDGGPVEDVGYCVEGGVGVASVNLRTNSSIIWNFHRLDKEAWHVCYDVDKEDGSQHHQKSLGGTNCIQEFNITLNTFSALLSSSFLTLILLLSFCISFIWNIVLLNHNFRSTRVRKELARAFIPCTKISP